MQMETKGKFHIVSVNFDSIQLITKKGSNLIYGVIQDNRVTLSTAADAKVLAIALEVATEYENIEDISLHYMPDDKFEKYANAIMVKEYDGAYDREHQEHLQYMHNKTAEQRMEE